MVLLQLQANGGNAAHELDQSHDGVHQARQGHVPEGGRQQAYGVCLAVNQHMPLRVHDMTIQTQIPDHPLVLNKTGYHMVRCLSTHLMQKKMHLKLFQPPFIQVF